MNIRLLAAAALGLAAMAGARADTVPTIDFFKHPQYRSVKISPDGKYLAATVPEENRTRLAIIKLSDMSFGTAFNVPDGEQAWNFFWVNDHRVVFDTVKQPFSISGKLEGLQYTGQIYAGNVDGGDGLELHGVLNRTESVDGLEGDVRPYSLERRIPNSKDSVLISIYDYSASKEIIYRLNTETAHRTQVAVPPFRSYQFLSDADGQVRYFVAEDESNHLVTEYRDGNDGSWVTLSKEPVLAQHSTVPLSFTADGKHAYIDTTTGVYLVDLASGERTQVSKAADVDMDDIVLGTDGRTPIGLAFDGDYPSIELFDQKTPDSQLMLVLEKTFKDQRVQLTSFSSDGKLGVVRVSSDVNPSEFFLVDVDKKQVSPLLKAMPWIDPAKMAPMDAIHIKARDGTVLNGYLTTPRGAPEKGLPLVVLVHGGPHQIHDAWEFDSWVQFLANRGYAVLQVNYRGSGGRGHDFEAMGYKHWGTTMQDDVTDATLWAIKDGVADPKRICIAGASYGGYSALMGVIREPDLYRCAFAYDGVYDLDLMFKSGDVHNSNEGLNYLNDVLGNDSEDLRKRSPVYNVASIKVPLFLAHGLSDERAPYAHLAELTAALDKAGKHYETLVKSKEGHGFYNPKNAAELFDKLAAFLDRNIGKNAAQLAAQPAADTATAAPTSH